MHLSSSSLILSQLRVYPLAEIPKSFPVFSIWWNSSASRQRLNPHFWQRPPLYSRAICLIFFLRFLTALRRYSLLSEYGRFSLEGDILIPDQSLIEIVIQKTGKCQVGKKTSAQWRWGKKSKIERRLWLPGQDSNLQPIGYKGPGVSSGLGLSLHPSPEGARVSGASPARISLGIRAFALVSAPSPPTAAGLGSGLPSPRRGGRASLSSPDSSTTISRGSCN